jgi:hypothetical protein
LLPFLFVQSFNIILAGNGKCYLSGHPGESPVFVVLESVLNQRFIFLHVPVPEQS